MADQFETIAAIIDAAGPAPTAQEILAELAAVSERAPAARKKTKSAASSGRPPDPSPEAADTAANPHLSSASDATPQPRGNEHSNTETLAPEAEEKIEDAIAACADYDHSDTDNGKRLIRYFGRDLLVMAQGGVTGGEFLFWRDTHWDLDGGLAGASLKAQEVGDLIVLEADVLSQMPHEKKAIEAGSAAAKELGALDAADDSVNERREELMTIIAAGKAAKGALSKRKVARRKHGITTKNTARIKNMLECAGPRLRTVPDAFNADPMLVATQTHTLRFVREPDPECPDPDAVRFRARVIAYPEHRRSDLLTAVVPIAYVPDFPGKKWLAFLDRCVPQLDRRRTLQAFTGLGLLGLPVQRLMYHTGTGANGKSVFLETITRALGDSFAVGLPVESVTGMSSGAGAQASPDIARLFGKRMLRVHELPEGILLKAEVIKKLTGGEKVIARTLFKSFFEFQPKAKPHMSGNSVPTFDGSDGGMRRRMILMEWTQTIPEADQKDFEEFVSGLLSEGPAILNWLIEGALDYLANGLVLSSEVSSSTQGYFDEMDPAGQFMRDCLEPCDSHNEKARDVFNAYLAWSTSNAKPPMKETRFGRIMKKKTKRDDTGRVHLYLNVRLHDVPEAPSQEPPPHPGEMSF